jgi:hypothetical protein
MGYLMMCLAGGLSGLAGVIMGLIGALISMAARRRRKREIAYWVGTRKALVGVIVGWCTVGLVVGFIAVNVVVGAIKALSR